MHRTIHAVLFLLALGGASASAVVIAPPGLINGDFSSGGTGWESTGPVVFGDGSVRLGDGSVVPGDGSVVPADSRLFQAVQLGRGRHTISFDYLDQLSGAAPDGTFHDVFFASLYFVDDYNQFDLDAGQFDDSQGLLDLQGGPVATLRFLLPAGARHFSMSFNNQYAYVIPVFELFDLDFIGGDSSVWLDNVEFDSVVPEPASLALIGLGLSTIAAMRRRSRKHLV